MAWVSAWGNVTRTPPQRGGDGQLRERLQVSSDGDKAAESDKASRVWFPEEPEHSGSSLEGSGELGRAQRVHGDATKRRSLDLRQVQRRDSPAVQEATCNDDKMAPSILPCCRIAIPAMTGLEP